MNNDALRHLPQIVVGYTIGIGILAAMAYWRARQAGAIAGHWRLWDDLMPPVGRLVVMVFGGLFGILVYAALQLVSGGAFEDDPFMRGLGVGIGIMVTVFVIYVVTHRWSGRR